jgi:fatty-acyl-CoA synthase
VDDDAVIRIMYTSGTESRPKGAMLSSRSLLAEYTSCVVDGSMTGDDIDLHTLPLYHCAQLDCFLGPDLMVGATSIILPAPDPAAVLAAVEQHRVTKYFAPPTVWIGLLRSPAFDSTDKSSLRKGYYGASPMPIEVLRELLERLPDMQVWNFYGQTEIAPLATILPPHEQVRSAGSAGWPALNVQTMVVDDDDQPLPAGAVGEVVHRTPHATLGYWRNPDKTAEAFRGGWFHSGDLGVLDDEGKLTIVDRKKDMIKTGGENVASREVEEAIYAHPAVAEVAVFAIPDAKWVEAVTAAVVLRDGQSADAAALIAHCRGILAPFKCPKRIEIVDALPKNPSGKILKRDLRTRFSG